MRSRERKRKRINKKYMFFRGGGERQEVAKIKRTSQKQQGKKGLMQPCLHTIIPRDEKVREKNKMCHGGISSKMGIDPMNRSEANEMEP
jgi:hypothetical protein